MHRVEAEGKSSAPREASCERCHPREAEQWSRSRHHSAFTNPDFQRSFAREPKAFCRECHAPLTRDPNVEAARAEARGVGCIDCHGDITQVRAGPGGDSRAPHPVARVPDFGTASCAGCHEFAFPEGTRQPDGAMMQTTMREHRASDHAGTDCATCHLPRDRGRVDHALASTRSDAAWRDALSVQVAATAEGVAFTLTPNNVGHALPTGDLFRRLRLKVEVRDGTQTVASAQRYLARHFEPLRRPDGTYNRAHDWPAPDDRLRAETTVVLPVEFSDASPEADPRDLWWWVDYERVDHRNPDHPERSTIASRVGIASGQLTVPGETPAVHR